MVTNNSIAEHCISFLKAEETKKELSILEQFEKMLSVKRKTKKSKKV